MSVRIKDSLCGSFACLNMYASLVLDPQEVLTTYELWSKLLKGGYIGDYIGTTIGVIKGDTRSLDNGTYGTWSILRFENG